jgi:hypothetical protein
MLNGNDVLNLSQLHTSITTTIFIAEDMVNERRET